MKKSLILVTILFLLLTSLSASANYCAANRPDIQTYIDSLVQKYHFDRDRLDKLFCTVTINEEVITKLSQPAEAKPWYVYERLVITPEKINKGVAYWQKHESTLRQVEKKYGVPASIIVAIIGIETKYGENKGTYPCFNTLVTLAFNNGRRADYFRSELTHYLLLARENQFMPLELKGSYAGAVGLPQFMPSSYRHYAVDFDNKGAADLFNDDADAIASIANYLHKHGWQASGPVTISATVEGDPSSLVSKKFKPRLTGSELEAAGVKPAAPLHGHKAALIQLEGESGPIYELGLQNFYVISTYNNSALYVMAVTELAEKIQVQKNSGGGNPRAESTIPVPGNSH